MKKTTLFTTLGMALSLGVGLFAGLNTNRDAKLEKVDATGETTIYLDLSTDDDWSSSGAQTYLRVFTSPNTTFYGLDEFDVVETDFYSLTADLSAGCQLVRIASGVAKNEIKDWSSDTGGSIWTYGSNRGDGNDLCKVSGYAANWSTAGVEENYSTATTTPSTATKRIWVNPQASFLDSSARAGLRYWGAEITTTVVILDGYSQTLTLNGKTLYYVDIPVAANFQLVRLHDSFNYIWTYGSDFIDGYNTTKIIYAYKDGDYAYSANNESYDPGNYATLDYIKAVIDGYSTCVDSSVNGFRQYTNIMNLVATLSASDQTALESATFAGGAYTYGAKLSNMNRKNNGTYVAHVLLTLNESTNSALIITIISVSIIAVLALGGYFFIRSRKEN